MKRLLIALLALVAAPAFADAKFGVVGGAAQTSGTPPYTQDFTDSGVFGGDTPKFAICQAADTTSTDTSTNPSRFLIGVSDGTREGSLSLRMGNNAGNSLGSYATYNNRGHVHVDSAGNVDAYANITFVANGVRFTWQDAPPSGYDIRCMAGSGDIEAGVSNLTSNNGTSAQSVTHNLTGTPDLIVTFNAGQAANGDANTNTTLGIGFYSSTAQVGYTQSVNSAVATNTTAARLSSTTAVNKQTANSANYTYTGTISNVGATTFDVTFNAAHTNHSFYLALRGINSKTLYVKTGTFTAKTSTGTNADISGMSGAPQALLAISTQLTALDTGSTAAASEGFSFGMAAKGSGTTQYGTVSSLTDDAVTPSATTFVQMHSTAYVLHTLTTAGGNNMRASVNSWDSGGVTHNYATSSGAADYVAYAAFGSQTVTAPTFSVAPTVSAQDTNDYTLSYTVTSACTFYAVACAKDSTAATEAQVEAGNCTGDVAAIASASESVTGADTTVLGGSLVRPVHDIYAFCKNVAGDTNITTLADECLDAASGKTLVNCATGLTSIDSNSPIVTFNTSATPDIAAGDIPTCDSNTTPGNCAITHTATGLYSYDGSCSTSQYFDCNFYDASVGANHADTMRTYVNNGSPQAIQLELNIDLTKDAAMAAIDFCADYFTDPEGDALTCSTSDTGTGTGADKRPAGTTLTAGAWSGTPTSAYDSTGTFTVTATDVAGNTATMPVFWSVPSPLTVPDCSGLSLAACEALADGFEVTTYPQCYVATTTTVSTVLSQYPAASSSAQPGASLWLAVYLGECPTFIGPDLVNLKFVRNSELPNYDYEPRFQMGSDEFFSCSLMQIGAVSSSTTASGAGTGSVSLTLASAATVTPGAWLKIGASTYRRVVAVDWSTNVVRLAQGASWADGATVSVMSVSAVSIPGVSFASGTCRLGGTPTVSATHSSLVIRAMNADGLTADSN